ncbi:MAG: dihydropyrimidinase [Geminicoccaceae bacterium]|nr:MAG: dihydropyrimidinase [Geminicoccaceae bacterium]
MPTFDLVIKGGEVITASDRSHADVGIKDGVITALGADLNDAARTIDATGLWVMPGGIDSHVHIAQYSGEGIVMADDFESATAAAASGGNTLVMPFALQRRGTSLRQTVTDYHALATGNCHVDVSFHLIISDATPAILGQELPALVKDGYTSFKVFMTYDDLVLDDRSLLEVMAVAKREKALVMIHAEGYDNIRYLIDQHEGAGKTQPYYHATTRPDIVEREAVHRAISHAQLIGVPLMVVHVSSAAAMEQIEWAQQRGMKVLAETCPQYLTLTADDLKGLNMDITGAKYVCSPPPRTTTDQAAIWGGLERGVFTTFSSDHCPFRYESSEGKLNPKARTSFRWVPNGIPGIETRLPILFSEGVSKGRLTPQQFVALSSTNHAKTYGLYPKKGAIAPGADADLALWDPTRQETITQSKLHHGSDYTPWEGFDVTGWPVMTLVRGEVVANDGKIVGAKGHGSHIGRGAPQAVA